jgi:hypothetical protein
MLSSLWFWDASRMDSGGTQRIVGKFDPCIVGSLAALSLEEHLPVLEKVRQGKMTRQGGTGARAIDNFAATGSGHMLWASHVVLATTPLPERLQKKLPGFLPLTHLSTQMALESPPADREMIKTMLQYLWPTQEPAMRRRVYISLGLLVGAKVCA